MPIIELKNYRLECDHCGRVGPTWNNRADRDDVELPDGWTAFADVDSEGDVTGAVMVCDACMTRLGLNEPITRGSQISDR